MIYTDKVMDRFVNPRNLGRMQDFDGEGIIGDAKCGDQVKIYIKVENNVIIDASFLVFGCTASVATSSMTTELAIGKTIEEAKTLRDQDVIDALGGLPAIKYHCSVMGVEALQAAIENYEETKDLGMAGKGVRFLKNSFKSGKNKIVEHMTNRLYGQD